LLAAIAEARACRSRCTPWPTAGSPPHGRWWDSHDVREKRSRLRRFRHPEHGE